MTKLADILSIIVGIFLIAGITVYINEHIHVMCLFGKCAAVVN